MSNYVSYKEIVDLFQIDEGDTVLVGSDITRLAVEALRNGEKLDLNFFIDSLINKIGGKGTLLFPTFNWGFCNGEKFDYNNTVSKTGALTNAALKREDFIRTQHPIYSFAVWGKDKDKLLNMNNKSSFGEDSPFAYLHRMKAKMLTIGLCYQNSFTFAHYVEEMEKVDYRYMKDFTSKYIDKLGNESVRTYSMNVRDLDRSVVTKINPIGKEMEKREVSKCQSVNNVDFYLIDLNKAYDVIREDILYNGAKKLFMVDKQ
ncbi:AAC(3) family N-acetyltransferase [Virgibacillus sp. DJP39]|uniref:AAC(3) family N-acetyltransferase n=1 Tax=Virgibacillus sp. DJP39 TaxID=3409790 RepID=UPI003BB7B11A